MGLIYQAIAHRRTMHLLKELQQARDKGYPTNTGRARVLSITAEGGFFGGVGGAVAAQRR